MRENGGWDNFEFIKLEKCKCKNKFEIEKLWYNKLKPTLNTYNPKPTIEETKKKNYEKNKIWRENNRERKRELHKKWCENNKERRREQKRKSYYKCKNKKTF